MHSLPAVCRRLACCLRRLAEQAVRSDREDLNVLLPTRCELSDTLSQFCKTLYARNTGLQVCVPFTSPQPAF